MTLRSTLDWIEVKMKIKLLFAFIVLFNTCNAQFKNPTGVWEVTGQDSSGTRWKAKLILSPKDEQEYPPEKFKGYFDWKGSNHTGGREYISAVFDQETGSLKMAGSELEDADLNIKTTIYNSILINDNELQDGTWSSAQVIPGIWSAKKVNVATPEIKPRGGVKRKEKPKICENGVCREETEETLEQEYNINKKPELIEK